VVRPGLEIIQTIRDKFGLFDCLFLSLGFVDEVYLAFLTLGWLVVAFLCRCLIRVVVAKIIAGPYALDSCEGMNIEGQILRKT
jgi:hypothetical protein